MDKLHLVRLFSGLSQQSLSLSRQNLQKKVAKIFAASYSTTSSACAPQGLIGVNNTKSTAEEALQNWERVIKEKGSKVEYDYIGWSTANLLSHTLDDGFLPPVVGNSRDDNQFRQENVTDDAAVPPCYHLAYFPPRLKESELASDGYEMDFFPPKEFFAHRMWVGAKLRFSLENPLCLNNHAKMTTSLDRTEFNSTGRLGETARLFLTKEVSNDKGWCMSEQRCMVYYPKKPTQSPKGIRYKKQSDFQFTVNPSSIMLFRYSALTFNSHKIHYDYLYSTLEENHPDCLVHGPLSGTLMISKLQQQLALEKKNEAVNDRVVEFEYKCLSPLYVNRPLTVCGKKSASSQADSSSTSVNAHQTRVNKHTKYDLWILNDSGHLAVKGFALIQKED